MKNYTTLALLLALTMTVFAEPEWPEYRLTTSLSDQYNVSISGKKVIWDSIGEIPRGADTNDINNLVYFDIPDGRNFCISDNIIAYQKTSDSQIYFYNLSTFTNTLVSSNGKKPYTDGKIIVYVPSSQGAVKGYELPWQSSFSVPDSESISTPKVDGNTIIWKDSRDWKLWGFDISKWEKFLIAEVANSFDISGNYVVLEKNDNIYYIDISDPCNLIEYSICTDSNSQCYPAISGNVIVWLDSRNGNWSIYGYSISTDEEFQISENSVVSGYSVDVSNNSVVWVDERNGQKDIYASLLSGSLVPQCLLSLEGDFNNDCKVDFYDLSIIMTNWLKCNLNPTEACGEI